VHVTHLNPPANKNKRKNPAGRIRALPRSGSHLWLPYRGFLNPLTPRRIRHFADLEAGDTAGWEACATGASQVRQIEDALLEWLEIRRQV
jgi:hypothetical protein